MSWIVPISLFTHITETIATSSPSAASYGLPVDDAVRIDGHDSFLTAFGRHMVHCREHGLVLDGRGDRDALALGLQRTECAEDGEIVALRAAGGERDLVGSGANALGNAIACLVERGARFAPPAVGAARIPEAGAIERLHGFADFRADGGSGGVVEVNRVGHKA